MPLAVSITSVSSFSPLGGNEEQVWQNYLQDKTLIQPVTSGSFNVPAAVVSSELKHEVQELRKNFHHYHSLDDTVLFSILASRAAVQKAGWKKDDVFGINIGSSRGATQLFEQHHADFLSTGRTGVQASPSTTLGNISSWVANDLKASGPDISHSITCSTSLHAVLNGVAWLRSGMADKFLVGGSEASVTPFTIAQMKAMKIYSNLQHDYPSRALDLFKKHNTMVLGEGAVSACLEAGKVPGALAYIEGAGYATEVLKHGASLSSDARCLQKSMLMALQDTNPEDVDAVVMHAPGTVRGDLAEYNAIKATFGDKLPLLTTNKWKIGHTFGASGMLSLELAIMMIQHNHFIPVPYLPEVKPVRDIQKVLVNAVGFGGNAVSLLVTKGKPRQ